MTFTYIIYICIVFGLHDKTKFEITCYALSPSDGSQWRDRIESEVEYFKDISSLSAAEAAQVDVNVFVFPMSLDIIQ